jgi:hypothetical protein
MPRAAQICWLGSQALSFAAAAGNLLERHRLGDVALREQVLAPVEQRPFEVDRQAHDLAVDRLGVAQPLAEILVVEIGRRGGTVGDHRGEIGVPAGAVEHLAFARLQRHEHVDVGRARLHDRGQAGTELLLVEDLDTRADAGPVGEVRRHVLDRLRPGMIVEQQVDRLPVVLLPVEALGVGPGRGQGQRQRAGRGIADAPDRDVHAVPPFDDFPSRVTRVPAPTLLRVFAFRNHGFDTESLTRPARRKSSPRCARLRCAHGRPSPGRRRHRCRPHRRP